MVCGLRSMLLSASLTAASLNIGCVHCYRIVDPATGRTYFAARQILPDPSQARRYRRPGRLAL